MNPSFHHILHYLQHPLELQSVSEKFSLAPGMVSQDEVSIVGKDDWLFLFKGSNDYIKAYSENYNLSKKMATNWISSITSYLEFFSKRNIPFIPVVIPNKASVIPEKYPSSFLGQITPRLQLLLNEMNNDIYCPYIEMRNQANRYSIFRKLDTHFTEYGNLYFVSSIMSRLGLPSHFFDLAATLTFRKHKGDLGKKYSEYFIEKVARLVFSDKYQAHVREIKKSESSNVGLIYETSCANAPIQAKLIVFGNSFFERYESWAMAPYFCRLFSSVRFHWESGIYSDYVDDFQPDYAIFQTCERFLCSSPNIISCSTKCLISNPGSKDNMDACTQRDNNFYLDINLEKNQVGEAYIHTHPIGTVKPGVDFPVHQLVWNKNNLIEYGVTVISSVDASASSVDAYYFIDNYIGSSDLLTQLQSAIAPGKWALYTCRPSKDGHINAYFGIVLPSNLNGQKFTITCEGHNPFERIEYFDRYFGYSHWFMPCGCVIGVHCKFKLQELKPYLHFNFEFNDISYAELGHAYRTLANFTDIDMLKGLPDIDRIQRVASKNANGNSFLNGGRSSYIALRSIIESLGFDLDICNLRVLDWGVGCGRVARHFLEHSQLDFTGIDIDNDNVQWCKDNIRGTYISVDLTPPTVLKNESIDIIYSCSVLSHLSEKDALKWLCEMERILSNNGVALFSYNGLSNSASYLSRRPYELIQVFDNKLFDADINNDLDGYIPEQDYYRAAFSSDTWWLETFRKYFHVIRIEQSVVCGYQHIAVLRKKEK